MDKKSHYGHLKNKWENRHRETKKTLWGKHKEVLNWFSDYSKKVALGSAISGLMFITNPSSVSASNQQQTVVSQAEISKDLDKSVFLIYDLYHILPDNVRALTPSEEDVVAQTLSRNFGFRVTSELQGKRLNRNYGLIGAEQHLARYPGDNMDAHFDTVDESQNFFSSGMAPGLGAWGYFASSGSSLSQKDKMKEKYYIAVQTFLAPKFNDNIKEYVNFFKYRKMLVVNPNNGKAVVAVIGDAGPAEWTGKHLGGSPEVMNYLERFDGAQRGPVLYFFIDEAGLEIPLGPIVVK